MKVTLISPYNSITSYGLRSLSAVLKEAQIETQIVCLPRDTEGFRWEGFRYSYPEAILDQLAELTDDSDIIGITLMSNHFDNAVQITQHLHRSTTVPIVWGGIHPTVRPEECLEYADIVCVGEGEDALLELAQQLADGRGHVGIDNMWHKSNGEIVRTSLRPPLVDLDRYPYPDYDLDTEFVLHKGQIRRMTEDLLLRYFRWPYDSDSVPTYTTMMSRGCPYNCTYCCNNALRKIYSKNWHVRRRSAPNFVGELQKITTRFPGIQCIKIEDDAFAENIEEIRGFADAYKQVLGVPLYITGFRPSMIDEEIIGILVDAGMKRMRVGLQTGSRRVMHQIYRRPVKTEQMVHAVEVVSKFTDRIEPPMYDLIVDNPWETEEDQMETLCMLLDMPKPYQLVLFSLTLFPGTALYDRAKQEGILKDDVNQVYRKGYFANERTYINGLFKLFQSQRAPRWLMALLLRDTVRRRDWVWLPYLINRLFRIIHLVGAGWRALLRRDWAAFERAFRLRIGHHHVKKWI